MDYELFDLAFSYKKTKLWKKLWDSELFAVEHSDGSVGYCCVMGRAGEHLALAVYPGQEGLEGYRMMGSSRRQDMLPFEVKELALLQDCVMVSFQNKSELLEEEQEELAAYCTDRGVTLRGQRACPQFERFRPMHHPWFLDEQSDILHLKEALLAALEVSRRLESQSAKDLGFEEGIPYGRDIPLLTMQKQKYVWRSQPLPPPVSKSYPSIEIGDDITLARLRKVKKKAGEWAAQVFMHAEAVTEETQDGQIVQRPQKAPVYPLMLMVINNQSSMIQSAQMTPKLKEYAHEFTKGLVDLIIKKGKPERVLVRDERSHALFEKLCLQLAIPLEQVQSIEALEEALMDFHERFSQDNDIGDDGEGLPDQMQQILNSLEAMPSLRDLPDEVLSSLVDMLPAGILSDKLTGMVKSEGKRRQMI